MDSITECLQSGVHVNSKNAAGQTALMIAAGEDYVEMVDSFLGKGAEVNAKTNDWKTALMAAAEDSYKYN